METKNTEKLIFSEGLLIGLASAGAYLFSFYYEKGYASVFKIPTAFIDVSLRTILLFGAISFGLFLLFFPLADLLVQFSLRNSNPTLRRAISPLIPLIFLLWIEIYLFGIQEWLRWGPFALGLIIVLIFFFVFPLVVQKGSNFSDKLKAQEEVDAKFPGVFTVIGKNFGKEFVILIIALIYGIIISESIGVSEAIRQKEFLITNTNPEMVVLRIYGDNLICAPFDRDSGIVETNFMVLKVPTDTGLKLKLENIGSLHLPVVTQLPKISPTIPITATPVLTSTKTTP
jgi:hypothetical protein